MAPLMESSPAVHKHIIACLAPPPGSPLEFQLIWTQSALESGKWTGAAPTDDVMTGAERRGGSREQLASYRRNEDKLREALDGAYLLR